MVLNKWNSKQATQTGKITLSMMKHKLKLPETILFLSTHSSHVDPASSSETKMHFEIHRPTATTVQKKNKNQNIQRTLKSDTEALQQ